MNHPLALTDAEARIAERIKPDAARQLAISDTAGGVAFADMGQVMEFAKYMAVGNISVPQHLRGNPGACLAVCVQAIEWRMSPFAVANKSYSVNNRLAFESQLIQAVILQRAPIKGRFRVEYHGEGSRRRCKVTAVLADGTGEVDYETPEFDKIQPKNSPLWKTDPDQQQFYYAGRALCRRHFPDVLLGVYDRDELPAEPIQPGPRGGTTSRLADKLDAIAEGATIEREATDIEAQGIAAEDVPAEPAPDYEALVAQFEDDAQAAQSLDDLEDCAGPLPNVDQMPMALRTRFQNAWQAAENRIVAAEAKAAEPADDGAEQARTIDKDSPDYKRGVSDYRSGVTKLLNPGIKGDPVRKAHWEAGQLDAMNAG